MLDEDFPDQREHTTVVDYGRIGVPVPVFLPSSRSRHRTWIVIESHCICRGCPVRHPSPDPTSGSAGFQPALGYTELFAGKMPALPA